MTGKRFVGVAVLCMVAAIGFTGSATAGGGAKTKVTIEAQSGGFFGFVKSSKEQKCANGRKVTLFKQKGDSQDRKSDEKIGSDIAQANGDGYMWSTGNTGGSGKFYARVGKIPGCKADTSKTIRSQR